jgi:hypothetical protein
MPTPISTDTLNEFLNGFTGSDQSECTLLAEFYRDLVDSCGLGPDETATLLDTSLAEVISIATMMREDLAERRTGDAGAEVAP